MSSKYKELQKSYRRDIFVEKTRICNIGAFRYEREKASSQPHFKLAAGFTAAVRALPPYYNSSTTTQYGRFLDEWGTHVVTEIKVGSKYIEQFQSSFQDAYTYALNQYGMGASGSASFLSFSSSVSLNVASLVEDSSFTSLLTSTRKVVATGSSIHWDIDSNKWVYPLRTDLKEPIAITIRPIVEFLSSDYTADTTVLSRVQGLSTAMSNYASYRGARLSSDSPLTVPVVWPAGTYGLVQPVGGCPSASWNEGHRFHDTEDDDSHNDWSSSYNLAGDKGRNNMRWEFCLKLYSDTINYQWPSGQYCILKKHSCPSGLDDGYIYWDDEDKNNKNGVGGTLPDGSYDRNTRIDFCCRTDGDPARAIILPTSRPFILVAATDKCQAVRGMTAYRQWFSWDNEDDNNKDGKGGTHPYDTGSSGNHKLNFCYYT